MYIYKCVDMYIKFDWRTIRLLGITLVAKHNYDIMATFVTYGENSNDNFTIPQLCIRIYYRVVIIDDIETG